MSEGNMRRIMRRYARLVRRELERRRRLAECIKRKLERRRELLRRWLFG